MEGEPVEFELIGDELCLDFVNTLNDRWNPGKEVDKLQRYSDLVLFEKQSKVLPQADVYKLLKLGLGHPESAKQVLDQAKEVREVLFRIFERVAQKLEPQRMDMLMLNKYVKDAFSNLLMQFEDGTFRLTYRDDPIAIQTPIWLVVRSAVNLLNDDAKYVRECDGEDCRWLFVDRSKNHKRRWCDMKECGNRWKATKYYQRQRTAG